MGLFEVSLDQIINISILLKIFNKINLSEVFCMHHRENTEK